MPSRQLPNLDLTGFFDLGEDGWNDEMDLNLLKLSVLVQGGVQDKLAGELVSPVNGDIIILDEAHPTNANNVAVYDNGAWVYFAPSEGWLLYNQAQDYYEKFDGTVWAELATGGGGGGGIPDAPSDGNIYGRRDGAWVAVGGGGGSGGGSWKKLDSYDVTGLSEVVIPTPDSHHVRVFARDLNQVSSGRPRIALRAGGVDDPYDETAFTNANSDGTGSGESAIGGNDTGGNSSGIIDVFNARSATERSVIQSYTYGGNGATIRAGSIAAADHNEIRIYTSTGNFDSGFVDVWYFEEPNASGGVTADKTIRLTGTNLDGSSGDMTGWTSTDFVAVTSKDSITPYVSTHMFGANAVGAAFAYQDIDVSTYASDIDAGDAVFTVLAKVVQTFTTPELADLAIQPLDAIAGTALADEVSQFTRTDTEANGWESISVTERLPVGTRAVRITMRARRADGTNNNIAFDDFKPSITIPVNVAGSGGGGDPETYLFASGQPATGPTSETIYTVLAGWPTTESQGVTLDNVTGVATIDEDGIYILTGYFYRPGGFDVIVQIDVDYGGIGTWVDVAGGSTDAGTVTNENMGNGAVVLRLSAGDLVRMKAAAQTTSDANFSIVKLSSGGGGGGGGGGGAGSEVLTVYHQVSGGAGGGTPIVGAWTARVLDTVNVNEIAGSTLSANQVTLPAGTYRVRGWAKFYRSSRTHMRLRNITDGSNDLLASSCFATSTDADSECNIEGTITIADTKTFEFQYYANSAAGGTNGLGVNFTGSTEAANLASLTFEKVG